MTSFFSSVSVIIPVYNAKSFIEQAVDSAVIFPEVGEVLLIEDGSNDGSHEKCLELQNKIKKVKVFTHLGRTNRGAAESRNLGILKASFPFISFLDADDIYYDNRFLESLCFFSEYPYIKATYADVELIDINSGKKKLFGISKKPESVSLLTYLLKGGYFHTNSVTIRKTFFEEVGLFNQRCWPHEDSELWIRMASKGKLAPISDHRPVATYLIHGNNLSKIASNRTKWEMWKSVYQEVFFQSIGFYNRVLILKKMLKYFIGFLKI
ncbi:glycosyltransferase family 2 protein [Algoriphagus taiwanensis]|uniref:Glycosyltransferase 2-like domain-containing protein n=1 Tax=Algoriphagus taiwanensis TaxID=1445656 RepID=A0ABQ6Q869_9BACT|nr:hypothetical protein Ataiwa_39960 [Algoriphagus taiwanensis]